MAENIASDARFADMAKIRQARAMSPGMKFRAGGDLFEEACQWSLAGLAARFPSLTDRELHEKLRQHLKLAAARE